MIINTGNYKINLNSLVASLLEESHDEMYFKLHGPKDCDNALWALSYAVNYTEIKNKIDLGMKHIAETAHGFYSDSQTTYNTIIGIINASDIKQRCREIHSAVKCALRALSPTQRRLVLWLISGKSLSKAASAFGKSRYITEQLLIKALVALDDYLCSIGIDGVYINQAYSLLKDAA